MKTIYVVIETVREESGNWWNVHHEFESYEEAKRFMNDDPDMELIEHNMEPHTQD